MNLTVLLAGLYAIGGRGYVAKRSTQNLQHHPRGYSCGQTLILTSIS